jgi:hypothetical protein
MTNETVTLAAIGQTEWAEAGHRPLSQHITAERYMDLLLERQQVYLDANIGHAWMKPLLEWFIWPGDGDFVILPDRTTATPEPTRTNADRLADAEAGVTRWTERLAKAEASLSAAILHAFPDDNRDMAVINIPRTSRMWKRVDSDLDRITQAERVRDNAKNKLVMAQARVRKYGGAL